MAKRRRKAPRIELHPMFLWIRGKMGKIVYRLTRNGNVSAYPAPDMSRVKAKKSKRSKGRPYDMALADYHHGNDMLWIKLYGDQEKPEGWTWEP